jgi:4a-hydroxytetrahydrobiopterin dehydratase
MVVTTVGHLAEKAWHHPDLSVSYAFVIVIQLVVVLI